MSIIKKNWNKIKETIKIEYEISDIRYNTWISNLKFIKEEENIVYIKVPDGQEQLLSYINSNFKDYFKVTISEMFEEEYEVVFTTTDISTPIKRENKNNINSNLNNNYIFDSFVVGGNNRFAQSAAMAVAASPGEIYNPLFIYGGPGLGKTHLMHAIGNFIANESPDKKILYVTSEQFTNEVIASIRGGNASSMSNLREKYRTVDILLIDDIQFLIGKEATQEEFFHTFNELISVKKQIVITSDKPPKEINNIDERIRSRFQQGLVADIQAPNFETRIAILQRLEEKNNKIIDDSINNYIAENITSNIRELEGAFKKVIAYSKLNNIPLNIEVAKQALDDIINPSEKRVVTPELILSIVSDHFAISKEMIASKKRNRELILPRHMVMYLCRELTSASLSSIATLLNKRDHTTIMSGADNIKAELERDENIKNTVDILKKKILP